MNKHIIKNSSLLLFLFLCFFIVKNGNSQSNGTSLRSDITVEHIIEFPKDGFRNEPVRLVKDEVTGNLLYNEYGGTIWEIDIKSPSPAINFRYSAFDHNLPIVQGMTMHDDVLYLVGNEEVNNGNDNVGIIAKGVRINGNQRAWSIIARTESYLGKPATPFDHKMAGNAVSPDGQFIYVSTNSRTNHGEVAGPGREDDLNINILKIPTNPSSPINLLNDKEWLRNNGYLYAEGIRNGFDMAFDQNGNLFEVENSGQRDDPEEMNWIREGRHYGFPYRLGGNDNPIIQVGYDSNSDPLVPDDQKGTPLFAYDPNFPAPPLGVTFTEPIRNLGPDADLFRDPNTGAIRDASNEGSFITTFTAHRSPVGFGFDNANVMGGNFSGDAFMASFSGNTWPLIGGDSEDLLHIELNYNGALDNYDANVYKIATGFAQPIDIVVDKNIIWLAEYGDGVNRGLWKITLPCGNESVCGTVPPPPTYSCDEIMVTGMQEQIRVSGLTAPNVAVEIYNENNELIFRCNDSCPNEPNLRGLAAGNYRVNIQFFNENLELVCEKNNIPAIVTGSPPPPPPNANCDGIDIIGGNKQIDITGLAAPIEIIQVFDENYVPIFRCEGGDCGNEQVIANLDAGDYIVGIQFYTANWELVCTKENITVTVTDDITPPPPPPPSGDCDQVKIEGGNMDIRITDLSSPIEIVQVFDQNYAPIFRCEGGDCGNEQTLTNLAAGAYIVSVQFYTAGWEFICEKSNVTVTVTGDGENTGSANCNALTFTPENGQISVGGLATVYSQVQIIGQNTDWKVVTICAGDCQPTQVIPNLTTGDYTVKVQLNAADGTDCYKEMLVTVGDNPPPPTNNCDDLDVFAINGNLHIEGLIAPIEIVQVFDKNYNLVFRCQGGDCGNEQEIKNLEEGSYFVSVQFYTTAWQLICAKENIQVEIDGNGGIFCDESTIDGFTPIGNLFAKAFYISNNSLPISDAKQACSAINSRLATSLTSEEIDFIKTNINKEVFIDLSDANQEGNFQWANGRTYEESVYDNNEVNDLVFIAAWNNQLIATNESVWKHFVCEIPCAVTASSNTRNSEINSLEKAIQLFPNPAQTAINLQALPLLGKKGQIQIYNVYGQLVKRFDQIDFNTLTQSFDISDFDNGIYWLTIQADNMPLLSKRFVVEHWK